MWRFARNDTLTISHKYVGDEQSMKVKVAYKIIPYMELITHEMLVRQLQAGELQNLSIEECQFMDVGFLIQGKAELRTASSLYKTVRRLSTIYERSQANICLTEPHVFLRSLKISSEAIGIHALDIIALNLINLQSLKVYRIRFEAEDIFPNLSALTRLYELGLGIDKVIQHSRRSRRLILPRSSQGKYPGSNNS